MQRTHRLAAAVALCCTLASVLGCSTPSLPATAGARHAAGDEAPEPLTDVQARADAGRAVFGERDSGNCVLCHRVAGLDVPFQGDVGPDLTAIGARLSAAQLRFRIVDASRLNPATVMPPYYRTEGLNRVAQAQRERTVLTGEQVEHLVAFLASLNGASLNRTSSQEARP